MNITESFSLFISFCERCVPTGLTIIIQTTIIIAGGLLIRRFLRKRNAALQSTILRATLVIVIVSPLVSLLYIHYGIHKIQVPVPVVTSTANHWEIGRGKRSVDTTGEKDLAYPRSSARESEKDALRTSMEHRGEVSQHPQPHLQNKPLPNNDQRAVAGHDAHIPLNTGITPRVISDYSGFPIQFPRTAGDITTVLYCTLIAAWIVSSVYYLLKIIIVSLCIVYIRHTGFPATEHYRKVCEETASMLGMRVPSIIQHPVVRGTFVCGYIKPAIVLPYGKKEQLMTTREVVLHEYAHLARHDTLWNLVCQIALILIPVQPLISTLLKKVNEVNDFACDDYVLAFGGNRRSYATQLFNISKTFSPGIPEAAVGSGILSSTSPLYDRIERILDTSYNGIIKVRAFEIITVVVFSFSSLTLTGFVGFRSDHANGKRLPLQPGRQHIERIISHVPAAMMNHSDELIDNPVFVKKQAGNDEAVPHKEVYTHTNLPPDHSAATDNTAPLIKSDTVVSAEHNGLSPIDETPVEITEQPVNNVSESGASVHEDSGVTTDSNETHRAVIQHPQAADSEDSVEFLLLNAAAGMELESGAENETIEVAETSREEFMTESTVGEPEKTNTVLINDSAASAVTSFAYNNNFEPTGFSSISSLEINELETKAVDVVITYDFENADRNDPVQRKLCDIYRSLSKNKMFPVWSPKGKQIAFNDSEYGVWIVDAEGGVPKLLYENYYRLEYNRFQLHYGGLQTIGFSPDGKEIAFLRYDIDTEWGTTVKLDETGLSYLIEYPIPVIESVTIATGETRILAKGGITGCWSRSGRYFAYITQNMSLQRRLWIRDFNTDTTHEIECIQPSKVCFSADDTSVYVSEQEQNNLRRISCISLYDGVSEVVPLPQNCSLADVSIDGRWILFVNWSAGLQQFLFDTQTGDTLNISPTKKYATTWGMFSPDGSKICLNYLENRNGELVWNMYIHNLDLPPYKSTDVDTENPEPFSIKGNRPNPFNLSTTIDFSLPESSHVSLIIYNIMGQKIRELLSDWTEAGTHHVTWDGRNDYGEHVSSGTYISKLTAGNETITHKMMMLK